ncbi:MAG: response regulator [Rhodocyclaceae bacterium]|nr:response regulator [Rhodocyclaceae bacterium]MCA3035582.1 response regulator [Rhodocyclaceae bacterium]MCA3083958.1 response regulator [Rhodocyclaceae bacterium]
MHSLFVVEDDPVELELTLANLPEYDDVEIRSASDGVDVLNKLRHPTNAGHLIATPAVILMDVQMPRLSGIETARLVRARPHTQKTHIVMLSNSDDPGDIEAAYLAGANGYLRKPSSASDATKLFDSIVSFWLRNTLVATD